MSVSTNDVVDDARVLGYDPLIQPQLLTSEIPAPKNSIPTVLRGRKEAIEIIKQRDDRLLVVVGPCSMHDPETAVEYCSRLVKLADKLRVTSASSCAPTSRSLAQLSAGRA